MTNPFKDTLSLAQHIKHMGIVFEGDVDPGTYADPGDTWRDDDDNVFVRNFAGDDWITVS